MQRTSSTVGLASDTHAHNDREGDRRSRQLKMKQMAIALQYSRNMADSISADEPSEMEQIAADNAGPEHAVWRDDWTVEIHDETWSQQMEQEIKAAAGLLLDGEIGVKGLNCRETVCRMFLQFKGKRDADVFTSSRLNPEYHYGFQLLNPDRDGEASSDEKNYNYEVIVKRNRPASV